MSDISQGSESGSEGDEEETLRMRRQTKRRLECKRGCPAVLERTAKTYESFGKHTGKTAQYRRSRVIRIRRILKGHRETSLVSALLRHRSVFPPPPSLLPSLPPSLIPLSFHPAFSPSSLPTFLPLYLPLPSPLPIFFTPMPPSSLMHPSLLSSHPILPPSSLSPPFSLPPSLFSSPPLPSYLLPLPYPVLLSFPLFLFPSPLPLSLPPGPFLPHPLLITYLLAPLPPSLTLYKV